MAAVSQIVRRLALIDDTPEDGFMDKALKVAFATSNQKQIDQHFGSTTGFAFYYVTRDEARFAEAIEFAQAEQDGNEDKLEARISALEDCAAVYCRAVGASAIAQLKKAGVQPVKLQGPPLEIKAQISLLQKELRDGPAFWILKALEDGKNPDRFDDMESEGWSE